MKKFKFLYLLISSRYFIVELVINIKNEQIWKTDNHEEANGAPRCQVEFGEGSIPCHRQGASDEQEAVLGASHHKKREKYTQNKSVLRREYENIVEYLRG